MPKNTSHIPVLMVYKMRVFKTLSMLHLVEISQG